MWILVEGGRFSEKAAPLKIRINQEADFEGLANRSTRGKFRLPFLRFFYETHVILGGLMDKNFKFRCMYVPIKLNILPITQQLVGSHRFSVHYTGGWVKFSKL